jgi:hypothetical protein
MSNQGTEDQYPAARQVLKGVMKLIPLCLIGPFILFEMAYERYDAPQWLLIVLGLVSLIPIVIVFCGTVNAWAMIGPVTVVRRKATPEEEIAQQTKQAELLQQKTKKAEAEKEFLKEQIEVADLENRLMILKGEGQLPTKPSPIIADLRKKLENVKDFHEGLMLISQKRDEYPKEKYPQVAEVLDTLEDDLRERFLRKP